MSIPQATIPVSEGQNLPKVLVPEGSHFARIFKIIDLGTQKQEFKGESKPDARMYCIMFEFPKVTHVFKEENGKQPLARSKNVKFSFTSQESSLKSVLTSIVEAVGDDPYSGDYNIFSLLGKALQVKVAHDLDKQGETKDKVIAFSPLSEEQKEMAELKPEIYAQVNPNFWFYLDKKYFDQEFFDKLPNWQQEMITKSPEYEALFETPKKSKVVEKLNEGLPEITDELVNSVQTQMPF